MARLQTQQAALALAQVGNEDQENKMSLSGWQKAIGEIRDLENDVNDTPRTDAAKINLRECIGTEIVDDRRRYIEWYVPVNECKKLERELAAANERADDLQRQLTDAEAMVTKVWIDKGIAALQEQCEQHIKRADEAERDAARYRHLRAIVGQYQYESNSWHWGTEIKAARGSSPEDFDADVDEGMKNG